MDIDDKIEALASKADMEVEEVESLVDKELENLKDHQASEIPEEQLRDHAFSIVKNDALNFNESGFGGGEAEELPILTLGFQRKEADYFVTDNDAILGSGIINPSDDPAGAAVFLIDSGHGVDLEHAADAFQPLNTVRGYASKRIVGSRDGEPTINKGGNNVYLVNSTDESKFEVVDPDQLESSDPLSELPTDREAKREMIHNNFITEEETATLQNYADHETLTNDKGFEIAFGADLKRVRGEVVDSVAFDTGNGILTITDDTIFGKEDVPEDLITDDTRTPGMKVMAAKDLVYGEGSVVDFYGYIEQRDDGQYRFQALGSIPIVEMDYEGGEIDTSDSGPSGDDPASEDTL